MKIITVPDRYGHTFQSGGIGQSEAPAHMVKAVDMLDSVLNEKTVGAQKEHNLKVAGNA